MISILKSDNKEDQINNLELQECNSCGDGTNLHRDLTATGKWIDLIHKYYIHLMYMLPKGNIETGKIKYPFTIYDNDKISKMYDIELPSHNESNKYFIRIDNCSARDADILPVKTIQQVINAIESSLRCQAFILKQDVEYINVYLIPYNYYIENYKRFEFRGIVCKNKLNGLCQYYRDFTYNKEEIDKIIIKAKELSNDFINKYKYFDQYVMDLFLYPDHETVIEINSFGLNGICGLPLFDWKTDKEQLYGETEYLEIRYKKN